LQFLLVLLSKKGGRVKPSRPASNVSNSAGQNRTALPPKEGKQPGVYEEPKVAVSDVSEIWKWWSSCDPKYGGQVGSEQKSTL